MSRKAMVAILIVIAFTMFICIHVYVVNEGFNVQNIGSPSTDLDPLPWNEDIAYSNDTSDDVVKRHRMEDSIPVEKVSLYPTAYYYEYGNAEYEERLRRTFRNLCTTLQLSLHPNDWKGPFVPDVASKRTMRQYADIVPYLEKTLNSSEYLTLPGDNPKSRPNIQVVHDRWLQYYASNDGSMLRYDIEVLLYREAKFEGKHVALSVIKHKNKGLEVVAARVVGVVPEDKIILFPVTLHDPLNNTYSKPL